MDEFDRNNPEELPPKYRKHSTEYITLRKKQKTLARNHDFASAEIVKRQADKLEAFEERRQLEKLQSDLQFKRDMLIDKHNKQIEKFAQWVTERRNMLLNNREKQMQGSIRRLDHYTMLVNNIEKSGLPPNPTNGMTTNRVSRNESIRAVRNAAASPFTRTSNNGTKRQSLPHQYRPQSSVSIRKTPIITPVKNGGKR